MYKCSKKQGSMHVLRSVSWKCSIIHNTRSTRWCNRGLNKIIGWCSCLHSVDSLRSLTKRRLYAPRTNSTQDTSCNYKYTTYIVYM